MGLQLKWIILEVLLHIVICQLPMEVIYYPSLPMPPHKEKKTSDIPNFDLYGSDHWTI